MMSIFNILVYVLFAYVMCNYANKSYELEPVESESFGEENKIDKNLWIFIIIFTLICAFRGRTGVDTLSYVYSFKEGFLGGNTKMVNGEWGFYYLCEFFAKNNIHFSFGLGICGFVQIFFIVKGILPYKSLLCYFPIVLFGGPLFLGLTNAVRQMMAAAIFFYAIKFIVNKKIIYYCISIFAASLFHHSVLMLLPLYFIPKSFNISSRRTVLLAIYIGCFILGNTPQFQGFISYLEVITKSAGYDNYVSAASEILNEGYIKEVKSFGPMQLSYFLCGLAVIWYGPYLSERYSKSMNTFKLWYLFAVVYGCLYFLFCNVSHLLIRPIMYFSICQTVMLALIIKDLFEEGEIDASKKQTAWLFIAIIWVNIIWEIIKNAGNPLECTTYKLFFL